MTVVPKAPRRVAAALERIPRSTHILLVVMFLVAGIATAFFVSFSYLHLHHGFARTMARFAPYPAYIADGEIVWYVEISERAHALEQVAGLPPDEAVARAATLALQHKALLSLADELGVAIPPEELASFIVHDSALTLLKDVADWREKDYANLGARSLLFAKAVEDAALRSTDLQSAVHNRAARLQGKLAEGVPFYEVAQQYSDGANASQGGDLGYVAIADLPEALQTFVRSAAIGTISGSIETHTSIWIVRVEDILDGEEGTVWLRAIELKKDLLRDILQERVADMTVITLLQ